MTLTVMPVATCVRRLARVLLAPFAALIIGGCVYSDRPLLTDGKPMLGERARLTFYSLSDGAAHDAATARYRWDGTRYVAVSGGRKVVRAFSAHPMTNGDFILQGAPKGDNKRQEYAIAHKLAEGLYEVALIDEKTVDDATRAKLCVQLDTSTCRIETREALIALADAMAAKPRSIGAIAVILEDGKR